MDKPDPPAALDDTRAVAERVDAKGRVLRALDEAQATAAIDALCSSGIEALTVSLMHAYANPAHERALRDIVAARFPDLPVSLSSDILPEFREYDRTITTVINDYVRPVMRRYLSRIEDSMAAEGMQARLHIVRSDGGLMSAKAAADRPVHTVLSGPAGGVTSTVMLARQTGREHLLGFDMGGTSTDVAVVLAGEPQISRTTEVGSFPAKVPTPDVRSVGAGGGSIAEVSDLTGSLRVGPRSAGSVLGPVAYGRGGTEPTTSDANLVLGYLSPALLDGSMALDVAGARAAVAALGARIGLGPEQTAQGILYIANETMLGALRVITVQRGLDPRIFGLVAFGGAGPLHGNALAAVLGCFPVIVPPHPGVFSALGFVRSEFKNEFTQTLIRTADNGGAGLHRGGCGIEKIYRVLASGVVSIHDDRETVPPWGINGGLHGGTSSKHLIRAGSEVRERVKSKIDNLKVEPGDRIVFATAGSGGWGDPLERLPALEARDVRYGVVSVERAASDYGVVTTGRHTDEGATAALRAQQRVKRGPAAQFDFGARPEAA